MCHMAFGVAEKGCFLRSSSVHDGPDVVHPLLQRLHLHAIGHAGAAFVEANQSREPTETFKHVGECRDVPVEFEMKHEPGDENNVART